TLFPYTTLFRSVMINQDRNGVGKRFFMNIEDAGWLGYGSRRKAAATAVQITENASFFDGAGAAADGGEAAQNELEHERVIVAAVPMGDDALPRQTRRPAA